MGGGDHFFFVSPKRSRPRREGPFPGNNGYQVQYVISSRGSARFLKTTKNSTLPILGFNTTTINSRGTSTIIKTLLSVASCFFCPKAKRFKYTRKSGAWHSRARMQVQVQGSAGYRGEERRHEPDATVGQSGG